jgi:hypothetical protein
MNIVVQNSSWTQRDIDLLFGDEPVIFTVAKDLQTLVTDLNLFPSKTKAVAANRVGDIPHGWNVIKGNKKVTLWIWNPTE